MEASHLLWCRDAVPIGPVTVTGSYSLWSVYMYTAVQSQKAVTADSKSKQLLHFGFQEQVPGTAVTHTVALSLTKLWREPAS